MQQHQHMKRVCCVCALGEVATQTQEATRNLRVALRRKNVHRQFVVIHWFLYGFFIGFRGVWGHPNTTRIHTNRCWTELTLQNTRKIHVHHLLNSQVPDSTCAFILFATGPPRTPFHFYYNLPQPYCF